MALAMQPSSCWQNCLRRKSRTCRPVWNPQMSNRREEFIQVARSEAHPAPHGQVSDLVVDAKGHRAGWKRLQQYFDEAVAGWSSTKWNAFGEIQWPSGKQRIRFLQTPARGVVLILTGITRRLRQQGRHQTRSHIQPHVIRVQRLQNSDAALSSRSACGIWRRAQWIAPHCANPSAFRSSASGRSPVAPANAEY